MGDLIAEVPSDPDTDPMPRAHLLAAAPEMQAALKRWDRLERTSHTVKPGDRMHAVRFQEAVEATRAVLAKAKGARRAATLTVRRSGR